MIFSKKNDDMNRILKYIPLLLVLLALASCSSEQKVIFSGKPGTEIYNTDYRVGKVDNSGSATVEIYYDDAARLMFSKDPESGTFIPFAINMNPKRSSVTGRVVGITFRGLGAGYAGAGLIFMTFDPGFGACFLSGGLAFLATGYLAGRLNQPFYIAKQTINQDIVFTPLVETADYKTFVPKSQRMKDQPKSGSQRANTTRRSGNSRYKADDDYTKNVIGTYSGNGKLMFEGAVTEKYNDIKVVIEKVSGEANMVTVNVMLDDGMPYFGSKSKYSITKNDDEYVLIHESVNSTISINQYGELVYLNNDVEDDNGINILKINADKE